MTIFQKFIVIIAFLAVGIAGFYLYHQEQIKKDELSLKAKQQKFSECKYLLDNKELILAKDIKRAREARNLYDLDPNNKEYKEYRDYNSNILVKSNVEYEKSADNCRDLLRKLNY